MIPLAVHHLEKELLAKVKQARLDLGTNDVCIIVFTDADSNLIVGADRDRAYDALYDLFPFAQETFAGLINEPTLWVVPVIVCYNAEFTSGTLEMPRSKTDGVLQ